MAAPIGANGSSSAAAAPRRLEDQTDPSSTIDPGSALAAQMPRNAANRTTEVQPDHPRSVDERIKLADIHGGPSLSAAFLDRAKFTNADNDAIVQGLAKRGDFASFYPETSASNDPSGQERTAIAGAISHAFRSNAISQDDLMKISDANTLGNGAQRFISLMRHDPRASEPGGPLERLGEGLQKRADDLKAGITATTPAEQKAQIDTQIQSAKEGAALAFTASPELMARNLNSTDKAAAAFEALNGLTARQPWNDRNAQMFASKADRETWNAEARGSAARLFVGNAEGLVNRYTSGDSPNVAPLAEFHQQVISPDAKGVMLDRQRDLQPAVRDALATTGAGILNQAKTVDVNDPTAAKAATEKNGDVARQYGALADALELGTFRSAVDYVGRVGDTVKTRAEVKGMLTMGVGALKDVAVSYAQKAPIAGQILGKTLGNSFDSVVDGIVAKMVQDPGKPNADLTQQFQNDARNAVGAAGNGVNDHNNMINSFGSVADRATNKALREEVLTDLLARARSGH
jgi:hypothetical protein